MLSALRCSVKEVFMRRMCMLPFLLMIACAVTLVAAGDKNTGDTSSPSKSEHRDIFRGGRVTPDEMATIAQTFCADGYAVTQSRVVVPNDGSALFVVGVLTTKSGRQYNFGDILPPGEVIVSGMAWVMPRGPDAFMDYDGYNGVLEVAAGEMVVVGDVLDTSADGGTPASTGPQTCTVTCGTSAYYACCSYRPDGYPTCHCKKQTENASCASGGPGASQCSLSQSPPGSSQPGNKPQN